MITWCSAAQRSLAAYGTLPQHQCSSASLAAGSAKMSKATDRARENLRVLSPTLAAAPGQASSYSAVAHGYIAPLGQRGPDGVYRSPIWRNEGAARPVQASSTSAGIPAAYSSPVRRGQKPTGEPIAGGRSPANRAPRAVFRAGRPTVSHVYAHEGKHGSIPRPAAYTSQIRLADGIQRRQRFGEGDYVSPIRRFAAAGEEEQAAAVKTSPNGSNCALLDQVGSPSPDRGPSTPSPSCPSPSASPTPSSPLRRNLLELLPAAEETRWDKKLVDQHVVLARHNDELVKTLSREAEHAAASSLAYSPSKALLQTSSTSQLDLDLSRVMTLSHRRRAAGVHGGKSKYEYLVIWRAAASSPVPTGVTGAVPRPSGQPSGVVMLSQPEPSWLSGAVLSRDSRCALLVQACDRRAISIEAAEEAASTAAASKSTIDALDRRSSSHALSEVEALLATFQDRPSSTSAVPDFGVAEAHAPTGPRETPGVANGMGLGLPPQMASKKLPSASTAYAYDHNQKSEQPSTPTDAGAVARREAEEAPAVGAQNGGHVSSNETEASAPETDVLTEEQRKRAARDARAHELRVAAQSALRDRVLGLTPAYGGTAPPPITPEAWAQAALATSDKSFDDSSSSGQQDRHANAADAGTTEDRVAASYARLATARKAEEEAWSPIILPNGNDPPPETVAQSLDPEPATAAVESAVIEPQNEVQADSGPEPGPPLESQPEPQPTTAAEQDATAGVIETAVAVTKGPEPEPEPVPGPGPGPVPEPEPEPEPEQQQQEQEPEATDGTLSLRAAVQVSSVATRARRRRDAREAARAAYSSVF
eukprot:COSAG02_NODE_2298_length_9193_cov_83.003189_5_plen_819_part_00